MFIDSREGCSIGKKARSVGIRLEIRVFLDFATWVIL